MRGLALPVKFIVFGILLVIGGVVAAFFFWPKQAITTTVPDPSLAQTAAIAKTDSDNDGLLDWEETLLSTNPNKADTDKDGVPDGTEVREKRNPLIPGPNDSVNVGTSTILTKNTVSTDGTITDQVAKDLISTVLTYRQSGSLDTAHQNELVNTLVDSANKRALSAQYEATDLTITSTESTSTRAAYKKQVIAALKPLNDNKTNELMVIGIAVEHKSADEKKKADELIVSYKAARDAFAQISVPPSAASVHLSFLNTFAAFISGLDSLRTLEVDPVYAAITVKSYTALEKEFRTSAQSLGAYFQKYRVE